MRRSEPLAPFFLCSKPYVSFYLYPVGPFRNDHFFGLHHLFRRFLFCLRHKYLPLIRSQDTFFNKLIHQYLHFTRVKRRHR